MRRAGDSFIVNAVKNSRSVHERPAMPRQASRAPRVDVAGEEFVGFARVAREQTLQILGLQIARIGVEELPRDDVLLLTARFPVRGRHDPKASSANCSSSRVCVAVTMVRTRALPAATVGNAIPCANTPASNSRSDNLIASAPSPTITGVIGLSLTPGVEAERRSVRP